MKVISEIIEFPISIDGVDTYEKEVKVLYTSLTRIQSKEAATIEVTGKLDDDMEYTSIQGFSDATLSKVTNITDTTVCSFDTDGYYKIKLKQTDEKPNKIIVVGCR